MFKKICNILIIFISFAVTCFGQVSDDNFVRLQDHQQPAWGRSERTSINVGLLMGGGGLIGADLEFLVAKRVGLQLGGGLGSMGFGINYHLKPYINTQFVSLVYMHQGFGKDHYASYLGPMYAFRARKIFQIGIGFGTVLTTGPSWEKTWENKTEPGSFALLYNIGVYFPL